MGSSEIRCLQIGDTYRMTVRTKVLTPAKPPKTTTLCPMWFFGGPHQWNAGMPRCTVVRPQKPPYQHKTTDYHEWKDGRCIHCKKTRVEFKPKASDTDTCIACGVTRAQAKLQAKAGVQAELGCEDYGHKVKRKPRNLRLVVNNTK